MLRMQTLYMPEGKTLDEVVTGDTYPLPSDTEAIIMKVLAAEDRLKSKKEKAVNDLDDVLKLLQKMHAENAQIQYQDVMQKRTVAEAFNAFYPIYKQVKEELGRDVFGEEDFKVLLNLD